jgi:hypothetical protein
MLHIPSHAASIHLSRSAWKSEAIGGEDFALTVLGAVGFFPSLLQFAAARVLAHGVLSPSVFIFTRLTCIMCREIAGDGIILFPAPATRCMPNAQSCLCWHHSQMNGPPEANGILPRAQIVPGKFSRFSTRCDAVLVTKCVVLFCREFSPVRSLMELFIWTPKT